MRTPRRWVEAVVTPPAAAPTDHIPGALSLGGSEGTSFPLGAYRGVGTVTSIVVRVSVRVRVSGGSGGL